MIQTVATETLPEIASASAAGTIETGREIVAEEEIAEATDHDPENDVITREIAQCHRISTDETAGETEIEVAETVAQDEMEIGGTALVGRTIGMIAMTNGQQNIATTVAAHHPLPTPPCPPAPIQKTPPANPSPTSKSNPTSAAAPHPLAATETAAADETHPPRR